MTCSNVRRRLEDIIERAVAMLDQLDGDAEEEANGDEGDQSYPEGWVSAGQFFMEDDELDHHDCMVPPERHQQPAKRVSARSAA